MADLTLAFDPSSSLSKGIYTLKEFKQEWLVMEAEVIDVTKTAIKEYESQKLTQEELPLSSAWVEYGAEITAVGILARRFHATEAWRELKYERAVPKVLAMVGAIATLKRLPSSFSLNLGMLLPYIEYTDGERFHSLIEKALKNFKFKRKSYQVRLEKFHCAPEGAGILMRGLPEPKSQTENTVSALVLVLGLRDFSYLLMEQGQIKDADTEKLGLIRLLEIVKQSTSGLSLPELIEPVSLMMQTGDINCLNPLLKSSSLSQRRSELNTLTKGITNAKKQHWGMLHNWMTTRKFPSVLQVSITGGTSRSYQKEFINYFPKEPINWCERIESAVSQLLSTQLWEKKYKYRFTDVYCYFYYVMYHFAERPLSLVGGEKNG